MADKPKAEKPKSTVTVGPTVSSNVQVIFVATYTNPLSITSEVSTAIFRAHADKQKKKGESDTPPTKTYVFEVQSLGDIKSNILTKVAKGEMIERIDILAHGTFKSFGLSGAVTTDDVTFDFNSDALTFDECHLFHTMADWKPEGFSDGDKYVGTAVAWTSAVEPRLTSEAVINLYTCNSGGFDLPTGLVDDEGVLLDAVVKLFKRRAVGFAGHLLWLVKPKVVANIFAKQIGLPDVVDAPFGGRVAQSPDLDFYRDLNKVKSPDSPVRHLVITRNP
jgi:hypothetical protein